MPAAAQASRAAGGSEVDDFAAETMEAMEIEILDERVTRDGEQSFVLGISSVRRLGACLVVLAAILAFVGMALEPYPRYPPDLRAHNLVNHPLSIGVQVQGFQGHAASRDRPANWRQRPDILAFLRWIARVESHARMLLFLFNRLRVARIYLYRTDSA